MIVNQRSLITSTADYTTKSQIHSNFHPEGLRWHKAFFKEGNNAGY